MDIRRATENDIPQIAMLLLQVHQIHAENRPDLFRLGDRKYSDEELAELMKEEGRPIFVAEQQGSIRGYVFCVVEEPSRAHFLCPVKSLYIDDLCVDCSSRRKNTGSSLYAYARRYAQKIGCQRLTLNVWNFNEDAMKFYLKMGMSPLKTVMEERI